MSFKSALQKFEAKDYKSCTEILDSVIATSPETGEAYCLKGLCNLSQKLDEKGLDLIKKGLELSPNNSVAWHIAGIWYKMEKNYKDAYHCYAKSYLLDQDNVNVQQDLGMLAMNERNFKLLVEVRRRFLRARPQQHVAWSALAVGQYLAGDYVGAQQTINLFMDLVSQERAQRLKPLPPVKAMAEHIDTSEALLFLNKCIADSGDYEGALKHLYEIDSKVLDRLAWSTNKAQYLTVIGSKDAPKAWLDLVHRNPNCLEYYQNIEELIPLDTIAKKTKFYAGIRAAYPQAETPKQQPLTFLEGAEFEEYLLKFMQEKIDRGVPSLFSLVKPFYTSCSMVEKVVPDLKDTNTMAYNLFMAKHSSYIGQQEKALEYANKAGDNVAEVELAKAKVYMRLGDFKTASEIATKVADSDKGDRFLNTKAVKYAILAGDFDQANKLAADFPTRSRENSDGLKYLVEFEAVDYLSRVASAYSLHSDHMMALKRADNALEIFDKAYNHQYDFHYYGPRRGTMRAYLELVNWVDNLYSHRRYEEIARVAVQEYVAAATAAKDGIDPQEFDAVLKFRKEAQSTENEDPDPWGVDYMDPKDPLDKAIAAWKPLSEARPTSARTWQLVFPVYLAQKKYVFAVQALKKAKEFGASDSWIASAGVRARYVLENDAAAPAPIRTLQTKMLGTICKGDMSDLKQYTDEHVTDDLEWAQTRAAINELDGVQDRLAANVANYSAVQARDILLYLRRWGLGDVFGQAVTKVYPKASFVSAS